MNFSICLWKTITMVAVVILAHAAEGEEKMELVNNGTARFSIVAAPEGPARYAAEKLQQCVREITGADVHIGTELPKISDAMPEWVLAVELRTAPAVVKHDGFRIRLDGQTLFIEASEPRGLIYGVYALLEELGCRFYGPAPLGVVMPATKNLSVPANLNITREPSFPNRFPSSGSAEQALQWGLNYTGYRRINPERAAFLNKTGLRQFSFGHIWPELVEHQFFADGRPPQKMDYTQHQDWLPADDKGVRQYNGETLCLSNPAAFEWFTTNAVSWLLSRFPGADYFNLWSADTWRIALCRCANCRKRDWNDTDWYLAAHNETYRKLIAQGWKGLFGWIVYHGSEEVPKTQPLEANGRQMDMLYAPRPRGGTLYGPFTNNNPASVKYRKNLDDWLAYLEEQKFQGTRTVFEYYYDLVLLGEDTAGRAFLIPKHDVMQQDMKFYKEKGFDGFFDCNPPHGMWWPDPLSRWLYHRLMWDVDLDVNAARQDFFRCYYGPFAGPVQRARETIEKLMFEPPTEKVVAELRTAGKPVEQQMAISGGIFEIHAIRLRGFLLWATYCALCKESEYHHTVTRDHAKGLATEVRVRALFEDNRDFLVKNGFMTAGDADFLVNDVCRQHRAKFEVPLSIAAKLDFDINCSQDRLNRFKEFAFDGDPHTWWSAGEPAPQWLEMKFRAPRQIEAIKLLVRQSPAGATRHEVIIEDAKGERTVKVFEGNTKMGDWLRADFDPPLDGVTRLRLLTTKSPSNVAWAEIKIE